MTEASHKYAILDEFDEETMARFIEYLYTKDYTVPDPRIVLDLPDIEANTESAVDPKAPSPAPEDYTWESFGSSEKVKEKGKKLKRNTPLEVPAEEPPVFECKKDRAWRAFEEKVCTQRRGAWQPYQNTESSDDYTEVFLCHARLYVFSDRHGIEPLRELSLQKMRLTLSRFHLFDERVPDIVELIRYTYANTMEHDQGIDELRSLLMDYVVCKLENIVRDENFQEMLKEPGALAKDLVLKSVQRLD